MTTSELGSPRGFFVLVIDDEEIVVSSSGYSVKPGTG
jgi:hypothetical protein